MDLLKKAKAVYQKHKKTVWIVVGGVVVAATGAALLVSSRKDDVIVLNNTPILLNTSDAIIQQPLADEVNTVFKMQIVEVHKRNLPQGYKASLEKIIEATERNIELGEGQTWVEQYERRVSA